MGLIKSTCALVLAISLAAPAVAAEKSECVTEAESAAIFASLMPDLIGGLRDKCAAHLPANAYLRQNGDSLIARYKAHADQRWPAAKLAFGRMTGDAEMAAKLPDEYFRPMLGSMIGSELVKDVKTGDCGGANRIVESLAPLPPENVAGMIGAILGLAGKDGDKGAFQICKP